MTAATEDVPKWYCIRTQVKREHIAAEHLRAIEGIEVFCPRLRYRKATARGKIWWVEPLFPGYILARFPLEAMQRQVTYSHGVSGLVHFGNVVPPVPDDFVKSLQQEIRDHLGSQEGETLTATPMIEIGDEVKIAHGPLQGMSGTVVSVAPAEERVKVLLEFLGQAHPIDIDLFSLLLPRKPLP